jgi:hypothetical protein
MCVLTRTISHNNELILLQYLAQPDRVAFASSTRRAAQQYLYLRIQRRRGRSNDPKSIQSPSTSPVALQSSAQQTATNPTACFVRGKRG